MLVTLSKFGLPIWFLTSFSLWIWLPTEALLALTPMVCALLLSAVGAVLIYTLHQLYLNQSHHHKGFYSVLFSALLAPPVAVIFAYKLEALLAIYPLRECAALAWFLSSMGAVLTIIVCRLLCEVAAHKPQTALGNHHDERGIAKTHVETEFTTAAKVKT